MENTLVSSLKMAILIICFVVFGIPLWLIFGPFYLLIKIIVTVFQPYILRVQKKQWNKYYNECLRKGIYIDYPPSVGKLFGIGPFRIGKYKNWSYE